MTWKTALLDVPFGGAEGELADKMLSIRVAAASRLRGYV